MDATIAAGAPHRLRVRTNAGDVWAVGLRWIYSANLALDAARHLRDYLAGVAEDGAPAWARLVRKALAEDGADARGCIVEVARREADEWKTVARFVVLPVTPAGRGVLPRAA